MAGTPFNSLPIYTAATTVPPPSPTFSEPINTSNTAAVVNDGPNRNKAQQTPLTTPTVGTCFRLLCHTSRIGGVIGKSGSVIKQLQEATSSKIRVDDAPPGSEYRVISVVADSAVYRTMSFDEESVEETNGCVEISGEYSEVSAAQEALVRVFERILSVAAEADGCYFAPGGVVSCRLLTSTTVVGFVIGRGGKVVEKIRKDTGCKIRILNQEKLPSCAMPADELIEIEGGVVAVKKALIAVSRRIQYCPTPDKSRMVFGKTDNRLQNGHMDHYSPARPHNGFNPVLPNRHMDCLPPARTLVQETAPTGSANYAPGVWGFGPLGAETSSTRSLQNQHVIAFRILCSGDLVGGVIGSGGTIIRAFENETGASISVAYPVPGCVERLITITATESPESQNSPAQNAVILVFSRYVETAYERGFDSPSSGTPISARLVIPHTQTGCLLGRGGSIMADMRKVTGAFIRIVSGINFPGCASETDEVVLMTGEFVNVRDALYSVTTRLRNHLFTNGPKTYGGGNGQPHREMHAATLTQSMDNLRLTNNVDHPSSFGPWQSQAQAGKLMNGHGVDRRSTSAKGGIELGRKNQEISPIDQLTAAWRKRTMFLRCLAQEMSFLSTHDATCHRTIGLLIRSRYLKKSNFSICKNMEVNGRFGDFISQEGGRSAVITNTTVEIMVPENDIECVFGENGSNLTRLREISGAQVVVHEPSSRKADYVVVISGTPDQAQSAQSLLQAFILADQH